MEFVLIFVVIAIVYSIIRGLSVSRSEKKQPLPVKNKEVQYEDPYLGMRLMNGSQIESLGDNPFYAVLNREDFDQEISKEEKKIAGKLLKYKSENIAYAIDQMITYDKFRERDGLPKYLQVIPINQLIDEGIFIEASMDNICDLLDSITMKELRVICKDIGISAARSKSGTVDRLLDYKTAIDIDYTKYFKLNPLIIDLSEKADKKINEYLNEQISQIPVKIKPIQGKISSNDIQEVEEKDDFKLAQYGYGSVLYFFKNQPLFRVLGYSLVHSHGPTTYLLKNGLMILTNTVGIRNSRIRYFVIINKNMKSVYQGRVENTDYREPSFIDDKEIVYLNIDSGFWALNYSTFKEKYIPNPDDKDIYSVLECTEI